MSSLKMALTYSSFLILLLCGLCMHACNARPLGLENVRSGSGFSRKVEEHDKHKLDSVQVSVRKTMIGETSGGNAKIDEGVEDLHAINESLTGNNISGFSSIATSQKTTDMEEYVKKALSKIRFGSDDGEKAIDSSLEEDGFDIDYEPPHSHPPVHHGGGGGGGGGKIQS